VVVSVLRGALFVNSCGTAICRCAYDFALIDVFGEFGRARMTRGTKVGWGVKADFLRWKNAVFWGWRGASVARAKAEATVVVLGVRNAWEHRATPRNFNRGRHGTHGKRRYGRCVLCAAVEATTCSVGFSLGTP
jgi:hypothetical protein